jgi:hypothetical protein
MEDKKKRIFLYQLTILLLIAYAAFQVSEVVYSPMEMAPADFEQQSKIEKNNEIS